MAKFTITETTQYEVEATDRDEAQIQWLQEGEEAGQFVGVTARTIEDEHGNAGEF